MYTVLLPTSGSEALDDPSSPQRQAMVWISDEDVAHLDPYSMSPDRTRQRHALATLFFSTNGSAGGVTGNGTASSSSWTKRLGFLSGSHECDWNDMEKGLFCGDSDGDTDDGWAREIHLRKF